MSTSYSIVAELSCIMALGWPIPHNLMCSYFEICALVNGADIEGLVGRAWRTSLLAGADHITREALADVVAQFMPSTQGLERELQETAAILECTDRQFLPPPILERIAGDGGRAKLQTRLTALKQIVEAM